MLPVRERPSPSALDSLMAKRSGRKRFESKGERQARRAEEEERLRAAAPDVLRSALMSRLRRPDAEEPSSGTASASKAERSDDEGE